MDYGHVYYRQIDRRLQFRQIDRQVQYRQSIDIQYMYFQIIGQIDREWTMDMYIIDRQIEGYSLDRQIDRSSIDSLQIYNTGIFRLMDTDRQILDRQRMDNGHVYYRQIDRRLWFRQICRWVMGIVQIDRQTGVVQKDGQTCIFK